MAKLANLARMSTSTTGTGTITLGSAVTGFLSFASAGVTSGQTVSYAIEDGDAREVGRGVYTSSGTTLTRSVLVSTNSNSAINLSGNAQVFISALAEDFAPTGTTSGRLARYTDTNGTLGQTTGIYEDGSGNLGIGITPTATLHSYAASNQTLRFQSGTGVNFVELLSNNGGGNYGSWISFVDGSTTNARLASVCDSTLWISTAGRTCDVSINPSGNVGLGMTSGSYLLHLNSDSAAKPSTSSWTVSSDIRLKENIIPADLARCWDIVKGIPLKRYTWRSDVYTSDTVKDRSKLGWIAQDVQPFFSRAVEAYKFQKVPVDDGIEEYEEQATALETVSENVIEIIDGAAVMVARERQQQTPAFDSFPVVDTEGNPVLDADGNQLMHRAPRMVTKTRTKKRTDTIDDCLSLNADQIYAAMYGALQLAMVRIESLENALGQFVSHIESPSP